MSTFQTMHFHQLNIYKRKFIKIKGSADSFRTKYLNTKECNETLQEIIETSKKQNNCITIQKEFDLDKTVLEILKVNDDYLFGRMGKEKDMRAFHLRTEDTLEATPIKKNANQIFEVFTYLLIDRSTMVVSYLNEISAPSIIKLADMFTYAFKDRQLFGEIASVSVEDAIPYLKKKDTIGTITYNMTLPPEESSVWGKEVTGLNEDTFESIENLRSVEITVKLVAQRNKDVFPDKGAFGAFISKIKGVATKVKVKAKDEGEYSQDHKIENNPLTKKAKFDFNKELADYDEIKEDIYNQMLKVYAANKAEILEYCKTN